MVTPLLGRDSSLIFMRASGGRTGGTGGITGGSDSGGLIADPPVSSILVRGNANDTTSRPVIGARRGSRSWPIPPLPAALEGGRRGGSPLERADPISLHTACPIHGRNHDPHASLLNGWWLYIAGPLGTIMLSVGLLGAHGVRIGGRGGSFG